MVKKKAGSAFPSFSFSANVKFVLFPNTMSPFKKRKCT